MNLQLDHFSDDHKTKKPEGARRVFRVVFALLTHKTKTIAA